MVTSAYTCQRICDLHDANYHFNEIVNLDLRALLPPKASNFFPVGSRGFSSNLDEMILRSFEITFAEMIMFQKYQGFDHGNQCFQGTGKVSRWKHSH